MSPEVIVDAQIHPLQPSAGWPSGLDHEQRIAMSAELAVAAMDAVGVRAALVNGSADEVDGYLSRFPGRFAAVPFAWFADVPGVATREVPSVDEEMRRLRSAPGIVGLRMLLSWVDDGSRLEVLRRGGYDAHLAAERHGMPLFVLAQGALADVEAMARAHPQLTVIVDHLGLRTPPRTPAGPEIFADLPALLELARLDKVYVKLTGAPALSTAGYPFADLWPRLGDVLDAFGADRLMWGSDLTRCRALHTYREAVDFLLYTDRVNAAERTMLLSGSLRRCLGWSPRRSLTRPRGPDRRDTAIDPPPWWPGDSR